MSLYVSSPMTKHHVPGFWSGVVELLAVWRFRHRSRHELAQWSERDLHDLGLSRGDIAAEIDKPFWRG